MTTDNVNHPKHYTHKPSGVECFDLAKRCDFARGNALKYVWRHMDKGTPIEDLRKALWYLERCDNNGGGWCVNIDRVESLDPFGELISNIYYGCNLTAMIQIKKRIEELSTLR